MKALFHSTRVLCSLWSTALQLVNGSLKRTGLAQHLVVSSLQRVVSAAQQFVTRNSRLVSTARRFIAPSLQRLHTARQGFSLVELMIVVAIIGVLTAIAIPNFQSFQRRSRQGEAKAALTSIYTAAQTFHSSWEVYAGALKPIGYTPSGAYRYNIGFADGASTNQDKFCGGDGGGNAIADNAAIGCGPAPQRMYTGNATHPALNNIGEYCHNMDECEVLFNSTVDGKLKEVTEDNTSTSVNEYEVAVNMGEAGAAVSINSFGAAAVGDLLGENKPTDFDTWTIDQEKNLVNRHNGLEF